MNIVLRCVDMCVCVTGLRSSYYDQIIRSQSSNFGQGLLQTYTLSLFVMYLFYLCLIYFSSRLSSHRYPLPSLTLPHATPNPKTFIVPAPAPSQCPLPTRKSNVSIPESPASAWGHMPTWTVPISVPESTKP